MNRVIKVKDQLVLFPVNVADHTARDMIRKAPLPVNSSALQIITVVALLLAKFFSSSMNGWGSRAVAANIKPLESPKEKFQIEFSKELTWTSARMKEETPTQREIILDLLIPYKKVSNEECEHIKLDDEELECKAL